MQAPIIITSRSRLAVSRGKHLLQSLRPVTTSSSDDGGISRYRQAALAIASQAGEAVPNRGRTVNCQTTNSVRAAPDKVSLLIL